MKVAHFDCFSGISGDMTLAALIDAGVDEATIRDGLASLNLPIRPTSLLACAARCAGCGSGPRS